ncbi:hypothetical protein RRG08_020776 [Elysia crispata]|uniref:Uncharacterized protein n=1 Tax=Elysia crispata TaxID=231223 RepID=A0AAE0YUT2_9GAST|nr:hypothetical protein RRG08_020776 [Elysia crispata]
MVSAHTGLGSPTELGEDGFACNVDDKQGATPQMKSGLANARVEPSRAVCCTSLPCDYSTVLPGASHQSRFSCRPLERVKISAPYKRCISSCKRQWKFQRSSCG